MKAPIRIQLTAVYCFTFFCSTLVLEIGSYWGISAAIYAIVDHDLRERLVGVVDFLDDHLARLSPERLRQELRHHEALQPALLLICDSMGGIVFQGEFLRQRSFAKPKPGSTSVWTMRAAPESMRLLAVRRTFKGRDYDLFLATRLAVPFEIMDRARLVLLLAAPLFLLGASLAGYWVSGRALAPVSGLTRAARSIGAQDLTRRVSVPDTGDELRDLALTINDMLARIENAFKQVTQFTANASHELRAPLALIRTTSEVALLRKAASAGTYREALLSVLSEAERSTALLDHLLFLARADAGQILAMRPVDIGDEIARVCEQVQALAFEKGLSLRVWRDETPVWVSGNVEHLRRLWLVLLDNAVKYTPGGGEIVVSVTSNEPARVSVDVSDAGIGISETDLPHIFERFFRADEARTRGVGGTGLGLAIARWVADAHDASIDVLSVPNQGTRFTISFARLAVPATRRAIPAGNILVSS